MEGLGGRIELIQIPQPRPAADAFEDEHYVGYYHLSFDITDVAAELPSWLTALKERFTSAQKTQPDQYQPLKVFFEPTQQIGDRVTKSPLLPMPMAPLNSSGSEQLTVMLFSYD